MSSCLTDIEHRGLLSGELDETDAARVRRHLAECEYCVRQRETLISRHDIWVKRIREAGAPRFFGELSSDAPTSLPGEGIIAGYEIKEELSRGGQGIVYRAIQRSTKREVAIKVLLEGPFASRDARRRFEREIELVAGFKHPNIVTVFDSGMMSDGRQYCVMDHVSGIRLDRYVAKRRSGIEEALALFAIVCDAVNYAHQRGVIHRDLKPSNILVDEQGQPKVLDFGMAKQSDDPGDTQLTAIGIVAGTLPYLSPELARGNHSDVDIRTDVYSLGVVLYEILTGRYPHSMSGDIIEVLQRIADTPPISPSRTSRTLQTNAGEGPGIEPLPSRGHRERLNPDLETILLKALAQTPERRYQSAGDMARDVRHYLGGEPIEARGDSTWYALKMGVRRYKWPVAAAALFILLISGSAIALALLYGRQGRLLVEVKQQKTLAQHRFEDVRSLARTLIFGLENDLSATHISATARAFLVNTALKYMNTLAQDTPPNDTQLMGELGAAYFSLGDIQGDPFNTNLGERAGALESYEKGLGYLEAVVNALPMDLDAQRELSVALLRIGTLLESMGRREEAQGHFRRAYQLTDRLIPIHPDDRGLQRDHVMNQRIMADYELSDGHVEESLALFESALKATESMAQADTDNENLQHDLAAINGKIGKVLELMGKSTEPLKYRQHSLEILGTLVATYPKNNRYQHDLATAHDRVGIVLQRSGDLKGALEHFQQGLTIDEKLVERDPLNAPARAGLRTQHCRIGEIRLSQGEMAAALESFERYQRESRRCAEIEPDNAAVLRDLAVSYYKMAEFEKARANDTSPSIEERRGCWKRASQRFGECRIVFIDMKNRGLLSERDRGVTDTLTLEIAACDNERKRLEQSKPLD